MDHRVFRYLAGGISGSTDHRERYRPSFFTGIVDGCGDTDGATSGDNPTCTCGKSEYLGVCRLSAKAAVGNREVRGGGCKRELLTGSALSDRGSGALTDRLPLEVIELDSGRGGGVLRCGTVTGGNRLYFDCPPVRSASTGNGRDLTCW